MLSVIKRRAQFVIAVIIGGISSCIDGDCIQRGLSLIRSLRSGHQSSVPDDLKDLRLHECSKCPIFFKPLQTCGTPLRIGRRHEGCHCFMPIKATLEDNCWAYDVSHRPRTPLNQYLGIGWPEELNSFP